MCIILLPLIHYCYYSYYYLLFIIVTTKIPTVYYYCLLLLRLLLFITTVYYYCLLLLGSTRSILLLAYTDLPRDVIRFRQRRGGRWTCPTRARAHCQQLSSGVCVWVGGWVRVWVRDTEGREGLGAGDVYEVGRTLWDLRG